MFGLSATETVILVNTSVIILGLAISISTIMRNRVY